MIWHSMAWSGLAWSGLVWSRAVRCGVVQYSMVWSVWCGRSWYGVGWHVMILWCVACRHWRTYMDIIVFFGAIPNGYIYIYIYVDLSNIKISLDDPSGIWHAMTYSSEAVAAAMSSSCYTSLQGHAAFQRIMHQVATVSSRSKHHASSCYVQSH